MQIGRPGLALGAIAVALAGCTLAGCTGGGSMGVSSRFGPQASPLPMPTTAPQSYSEPTPTPFPGGKTFMRGPSHGGIGSETGPGRWPDAQETPLTLGGAIRPLEPAPPLLANEADAVAFGNGSAFYVWLDFSGDNFLGGQVGGDIRRLGAWNRGSFGPRFADGGGHLLLKELARRPAGGLMSGIPLRYVIYPLGGGQPVVAADLAADAYYEPLPDGSGLTRLAVTDAGGPPAMYYPTPSPVSAPAKSNLVTRAPGGQDVVEADMPATRHGVWSLDSRHYASVGFRNADPLQGMDIRLLERGTGTSRLLYHLETDYFWPAQEGNFRWTPDLRVAFAQKLQYGASASVAVTAIPADGRPAEISLFPLRLASGESPGVPLMSGDARRVAFSVNKSVVVTGDGWSGSVPASQGVWICTTDDGQVRRVTTGGRPVAWLPDGKTLICATGRGRTVRYYLVDSDRVQGGGQ